MGYLISEEIADSENARQVTAGRGTECDAPQLSLAGAIVRGGC
jgi:hypothetical protein